MKMRMYGVSVALALLVSAVSALADIAEPSIVKRSKAEKNWVKQVGESRLVIDSSDGEEVRLQIPRDLLKQMRAANESQDNSSAAATTTAGLSTLAPASTVMAGLFLSLSIIYGGVWLLRGRRRTLAQRAAVALVACALCGAAWTTIALANAGLPYRLNAGTLTQAVSNGAPLAGNVRVEVVSEGHEIKLIVPKTATIKSE